MNEIKVCVQTLEWIIKRLESGDKKAAAECIEAAYKCIARVDKL
jgi:hypothetical protein